MSTKCAHNVATLTERLITDGLGYCCPWAFFSLFRRTAMIAARLGISPSTVRVHKRRFREGEYTCGDCAKCMKGVVKAKKTGQ